MLSGQADAILVPDTASMNGMSALLFDPWAVLSAGSIDGRIFSFTTRTRDVGVLLCDDALGPPQPISTTTSHPIDRGIHTLRCIRGEGGDPEL